MQLAAYDANFVPKKSNYQSAEDDALASELILQWQYLFGLRGNWASHWTEIAQRIYPMHSWLFQNFAQLTQQGDKRNFEIFDSTGVLALQRFGAILDSLLTPRDTFWHQLRANDPTLMRDRSVKVWFDTANQILFKERYEATANFASQNQLVYKSLGAYGTGLLFIDDLAGSPGLRYRNIHLGEIYLNENHQGVIDRVCRHFMMTARQAYQKFGDACPDQITTSYKLFPDRQFFFLHWVMPRQDWDPSRKDAKGMEFASYYLSIEGKKIVSEGGYRTFPYATTRYEQAPNEAYGRSPAMDALPAIKTLNEQKKTMLKQGHRIVDPVLLAHDDGIIDSFSLEPGAVNPGGVSADGRLLVQALQTGNVQAGKEFMDDERQLINDTFLVNLFQILTENPEMTATEVMERTREKAILLAPTIGRQQSEYLGPTIHRELDILTRQGKLPPMPKMLKEAKGEYKIVHDSPISRTMKAEWASGAVRAMEIFVNYAQQTGDQSVLHLIDMDVAAPEIADIYGTPAHWMSSPQKIAQLRAQAAHQQAVQQTIQAAPAVAGMMAAHGKMSPQQQQALGPPPGMAPRPKRQRGNSPLGNAP